MDSKAIIIKLNKVFCDMGKEGKDFSKVWLEDADFGGLYHSGKFILNVKAHHRIGSCNSEIKDIINILDARAKEELKYIWSVAVYNADDKVHCIDNIVYEMDSACP
jgi:hypothetical protein